AGPVRRSGVKGDYASCAAGAFRISTPHSQLSTLIANGGSAPRSCRPPDIPAAPGGSPRRSGPTAHSAAGTPHLILVGQAKPGLPKVLPSAAKRLDAASAAAHCPALTAGAGSAPRSFHLPDR